MDFQEGIKIPTTEFIEKINGLAYISWATALTLARRPQQEVAVFSGRPYLPLFGGAVVAVDSPVGKRWQRTWLPVMGANNAPIPIDSLTSLGVNESIMRCRAKAAAMVNGVGLSLYAGYGGDALRFIKALGIKPGSFLSHAQPLTEGKSDDGEKYIPWPAALAAARITDPEFFWEVIHFDVADQETGEVLRLPVSPVAGGWAVAVRVLYKGREHVEWLPIMGVAEIQTKRGLRMMDHQPPERPTVFDWNRSVMRALAKAIAVASGYGLSIYEGEDLAAIKAAQAVAQRKPAQKDAEPADVSPEASGRADGASDDGADLLAALKEETASMSPPMIERLLRGVVARGWVPTLPDSIEALVANHPDAARKLLDALQAKREKQ